MIGSDRTMHHPDPFVCSRCSRRGPTCCSLSPGQEEACFPLSTSEKERIQDRHPDAGVFALRPNSEAFLANVKKLFPGEEELLEGLFPPGKEHFSLAVTSDGHCRFLTSSGCGLPQEYRPYYCRLYPFWFSGGEVQVFDNPGCLARREAVSLGRLHTALNCSPARVRELHGRLRLAWGLPPTVGMKAVLKTF